MRIEDHISVQWSAAKLERLIKRHSDVSYKSVRTSRHKVKLAGVDVVPPVVTELMRKEGFVVEGLYGRLVVFAEWDKVAGTAVDQASLGEFPVAERGP